MTSPSPLPRTGTDSPRKILRKTTTELVLDALRDRILSGDLSPGAPLRQELLGEELGVSRIPVREALRLLSAEGFVDTIPHRGAFVSMISRAEVEEFFDIRRRLEPWIFREAIPLASKAELDSAENIVRQMDTAEPQRWGSLNWQLHEHLYRPAQRPAALNIVRTLHEKSERYFRFQVVNAPIRQQAHEEHMALIDLCRQRAVDQAEAALEAHIEKAAEQILAIVDRLLTK
ncbi:GntR family transcriptional regulator [Bordetella petrii]|uniref:GntR family transcriptional regulator n=1 Tax=Bordetella petrii TaxID=94624 RepID=UPI001E57C03E|nr:GntR family transcriptional regulator [Bordetella petrii]MCD0504953.1 GntR family transcriptional regulator [Bordetella petrii]